MGKIVSCRDAGMDCDFQARGATEQDVMNQCAEHAKSAHGMTEIPPDFAQEIRAAIRDEEGKTKRAG